MYTDRYNIADFANMTLRDLAWALNNLEADAESCKSSLMRTEYHLRTAAADSNVSEERRILLSDQLGERRCEYASVLLQLDAAFAVYSTLRAGRDQ